jgi:CRISPR-associated protein Csx3
LRVEEQVNADHVYLNFVITKTHLDYDEMHELAVPPLPSGRGVVLGGKIPHWLITALATVYREAPWLAIFQPQEGRVVVHSRVPERTPGDLFE